MDGKKGKGTFKGEKEDLQRVEIHYKGGSIKRRNSRENRDRSIGEVEKG
ncbi:MAG: hypothetical protein ACRC4S_02245 [Cetobacterium sp.]